MGYSPRGRKELDRTERPSVSLFSWRRGEIKTGAQGVSGHLGARKPLQTSIMGVSQGPWRKMRSSVGRTPLRCIASARTYQGSHGVHLIPFASS